MMQGITFQRVTRSTSGTICAKIQSTQCQCEYTNSIARAVPPKKNFPKYFHNSWALGKNPPCPNAFYTEITQ